MVVLVRNHFLVCDGINRDVASSWIPYLLGPEATSWWCAENGHSTMYYRSRIPLTPMQVVYLQEESAIFRRDPERYQERIDNISRVRGATPTLSETQTRGAQAQERYSGNRATNLSRWDMSTLQTCTYQAGAVFSSSDAQGTDANNLLHVGRRSLLLGLGTSYFTDLVFDDVLHVSQRSWPGYDDTDSTRTIDGTAGVKSGSGD